VTPPPWLRRRLAAVAGAALLLWAAAGFGAELAYLKWPPEHALRRWGVAAWMPNHAAPAALRDLLAGFEPHIPPGSAVVVTGGEEWGATNFFVALWAAYYLPRHRVIPVRGAGITGRGEYWVAIGTELHRPGLEEVARRPPGILYHRGRP